MVAVDYTHWGETAEDLREQALLARHQRTRERFLALYEISQGKTANQVAREIKRRPNTVLDWVHAYNKKGSEALSYQKSGGRRPLFL